MTFELPKLPYAQSALEPYMSARTLEFHHGKHHKGYVDKLNGFIEGTPLEGQELEEIIRETAGDESKTGIFNNAAQVWNHTFFWNCMMPDGGGEPDGDLKTRLERTFGSVDDFRAKFVEAATGRFGSGWAWLVAKDGELAVPSTLNAGNPLTEGGRPLLTCDVWEHAYYLDYQNERKRFVETFLDRLVNWAFVADRLAEADAKAGRAAA